MASVGEDFEAWYRQTYPALLATVTALSRDHQVALDITDESFARALAHWKRVGAMDSPGGWTYRVAVNLLRRRGRRAALERALLARERPAATPETSDTDLWYLVQSLSPRQRSAIVLRYVADLTERDVALAMGISRSGVASTLQAAHRRLGELMSVPLAADVESPRA